MHKCQHIGTHTQSPSQSIQIQAINYDLNLEFIFPGLVFSLSFFIVAFWHCIVCVTVQMQTENGEEET